MRGLGQGALERLRDPFRALTIVVEGIEINWLIIQSVLNA
jgi:hypothetical protein